MDVTCEGLIIRRGSFELRADLHVPSGAQVALIGPSGAGKSAFLSALAGFEDTSGGLSLGGVPMAGVAPGARPISMMFQDHNLFPHLSVFDNVALGRSPNLRLSDADRAAVEAALAEVDLAGFGPRYPEALSGGQASRVALARVLVRQKPVLLLDEPFAALGPAMRREMVAIVARLRATHGLTVLTVTHDPAEARAAELAAFVDAGRVAAPVAAETLFRDPPPGLAAYL